MRQHFLTLLLLGRPSLVRHFGQKISLLIMRRPKRSVSDFPCSDEHKQTVSEGTRSCAEVTSLVIEDCKSPDDLIRYMFGQFAGFSTFSSTLQLGAFLVESVGEMTYNCGEG